MGRRPHACVSRLGGGVQRAMSPSVVQCVPDPPRGAWNLWRARACGETEGRTDFTAVPISRGAESLAPRLRTTVNQITAKPEKGDPFWGLKPVVTVGPNHGGFEAISRQFGADSWHFQFTVVSQCGRPGTAPATGQAHTHSRQAWFRKPKRLRSLGDFLSIQPQKTMWPT